MKVCQQCGNGFRPKRPHAKFCSTPCRSAFHRPDPPAADGPRGKVKIVRRIKAGVSVTVHFTNAREAERAITTDLGAPARLVVEVA